MKSNDLGANPYMTFAISATVELIAIVITHQVLERFGRKVPYGISMFIAGLSCLTIVFIRKRHIFIKKNVKMFKFRNVFFIFEVIQLRLWWLP